MGANIGYIIYPVDMVIPPSVPYSDKVYIEENLGVMVKEFSEYIEANAGQNYIDSQIHRSGFLKVVAELSQNYPKQIGDIASKIGMQQEDITNLLKSPTSCVQEKFARDLFINSGIN